MRPLSKVGVESKGFMRSLGALYQPADFVSRFGFLLLLSSLPEHIKIMFKGAAPAHYIRQEMSCRNQVSDS